MNSYKKSYLGFILLILGFVALVVLIPFAPLPDAKCYTLLLLVLMYGFSVLLSAVILKNEKVYWYSGTTYEQAKEASSESRKRFAYRHFVSFAVSAFCFLAYAVFSFVTGLPLFNDLLIGTAGIFAAIISTRKITLDK